MPSRSDDFAGSVGVNVHLSAWGSAYYTAWPAVKARLLASGIRHVRDGININPGQDYFDHLNQLHNEGGINFDLVSHADQTTAQIQGYHNYIPNSIDSYEAPNEFDLNQPAGYGWASALQSFQSLLYTAVKTNPVGSYLPVLGPVVTSQNAYTAVGDLSSHLDKGNLHIYYGGRNPGTPGWGDVGLYGGAYGSMAYDLGLAHHISGPSKQIIVTETGYTTYLGCAGGVTPEIQAKLTTRTLMEFWNVGFPKTYLYEFADSGYTCEQYGLVDGTGNPKPAYGAVKGLLSVLTDQGATNTLTPLTYGIDAGSVTTIHSSLFEKQNGFYILAIWNEVPSWNVQTQTPITVAPVPVTITFQNAPHGIGVQTVLSSGNLTTYGVLSNGGQYSISGGITDDVSLLVIAP